MGVVHGDSTLSQPAGATAISTTQTKFWDVIDAEFRSIVASTSIRLASNEINTAEAGDIFSTLFKAHLKRHEILKEPEKTWFWQGYRDCKKN